MSFLETTLVSAEDKEEQAAYQELLDWINKAVETKKIEDEKVAAEEEMVRQKEFEKQHQQQSEVSEEGSTLLLLSNTDVLKRANQIDKDCAQLSELGDDEKPSDFISDCREVVNLSRGFNSRGQMRVGG